MPSRTPRTRRLSGRTVVAVVLAAAVLVITGFLAWASSPMTAEPGPLARAEAASAFTVVESVDGVALLPAQPTGDGLVYIPGARVEPAAYVSKLSDVAAAGITVVIARPALNLAIFETRPLSDFEALAPDVTTWFVGGHSLGGVRACQYVSDLQDSASDAVAGLILFGSYCAADVSHARISHAPLPVLSIAGELDALSTSAKIDAAAHLLPANAEIIAITGAVHGQFGDYGTQPGDGTPTATDGEVRSAITEWVVSFISDNGSRAE
jgi:Alpha/beta hydrolase family